MSFTLINKYVIVRLIVIQMISHDSIKYSYCIAHIFNKFTNFFCGEIYTCFITFQVYIEIPSTFYHHTDSQILVHIACSY